MSVGQFISLIGPLLSPHSLIMSEQNGTRPPKPYATVSVRSITPQRPHESAPDAAGLADFNQHQLNNIEVQIYGENASDIAELLALKLRFPSTADRATALNIGIARINQVLRVPELLNTSQFEERAILEFTAHSTLNGSDAVGLIETVEIDSNIDGFEHTCNIVPPT